LPLDAWMGVLAFSGQIFFDFAGYSTCAIGVAMCLGFTLPQNFRFPYAASGFSDFWRRWHMTLSAWLRDYLYIPLGGNRKGSVRTYVNLMLTMLLGGLWHGASWTFVVWGALHGIYLCAERWLQQIRNRGQLQTPAYVPVLEGKQAARASMVPSFIFSIAGNRFVKMLFVFFFVTIAWVFFRSADFTTAWRLLSSMFGRVNNGAALLPTLDIIKVSVITVALLGTHWIMRQSSVADFIKKINWKLLGIVWAVMVILLVLSQKSSDSFIYFQF
ncbi:MAG TPA: MBOAT family O-acyltransferase, partial [Puia sp.]|nr:MBOAT family O-acyltransferase [Puia sp.]